MSDELNTMEKKVFTQISSKLSNPEPGASNNNVSSRSTNCKQEGTTWSAHPRGSSSRRRVEASLPRSNSGGALAHIDAPPRYNKGCPQKSKGVDKKPRNRGNNCGGPVNPGRRSDAEVGSLQAPGAKKREWDNLFYFAPRERGSWKAHYSPRGRNDSGSNRHRFSKEDFLRANCQFLVKDGRDYEVYFADPDLLVDWTFIEQIVVTMIGEGASCPICLGPPVAAKMTRCGHIYCWPCILHYLALSDNVSRPCPICFEQVAATDLKSVVSHVHFDVEVGDILDMELIRRHKDARAVTPLHAHEANEEWREVYSKILVVSSSEVAEKILDREHKELNGSLAEDPNCPESCFIHQALRELVERKNVSTLIKEEEQHSPVDSGISVGDVSISDADEAGKKGDIALKEGTVKDEFLYFYQDCKGLNIFLHPMNFSMLSKQFGTEMTAWPRYFSFRVIDKEYYSATEESRKRWKILRHLPLSTPFVIVEVDLNDIISEEVMVEFKSQIGQRKLRREKRASEEKKMEKIIAERERKLWNIPVSASFVPVLDFPEFLEVKGTEQREIDTSEEDAGPVSPAPSESVDKSAISFAQIASKAPVVMKKSISFPSGSTPSWGTISGASGHANAGRLKNSDSEPENEDHVPVPEFKASMSDAISKALESVVFTSATAEPEKGDRRKKKNKGKVLFSTGGMGSFN